MSYGQVPTKFDLTKNGTTLIIGNNEDVGDKGGSRNGAGKTQVLQAILFGLFGKGIDKLKTDEYINIKNGKRLVVELIFEKGGKEYKIVRKRKPNSVELFIDGETVTMDTMKNTDDVISEIIGMDYEVFMTTYFLTPHREAFMAMSPASQRSMIESMLSLDVLVKRSEDLKLIRKDLEVDLKVIDRDIESAKSRNQDVEASIERLKLKQQEFERNKESTLQSLKSNLKELESIDVDGLLDELSQQEKNKTDIQDLEAKNNEILSEISELKQCKREIESHISNLRTKKEELVELIEKYDGYGSKFDGKIEGLRDAISGYQSEEDYKSQNELFKEIIEVRDSLVDMLNELDGIHDEINQLGTKKESLKKEAETLKSGVCPNCGQTHYDDEKLSKVEEEIIKIDDSIKSLNKKESNLAKEAEELESEFVAILTDYDYDMDTDFEGLIAKNNQNINELKQLTYELNTLLDNKGENPYETQVQSIIAKFGDVSDIAKKIDESEKELSDIADELSKLEDSQYEYNSLLSNLKAIEYPLLKEYGIVSKTQIDSLKGDIDKLKKDIKETKASKNVYDEEIKEAQNLLVDTEALTETGYFIENDIKHVGYLIKLLTDNKSFVRKNIVDSYIPFVNKKILEYTDKLGLPHICSINSDLSTDIEYMGKSVSYFNLSQGERLRLNLSVNLAFRDMITMLGKGSNILMIDEYMDSAFDNSGLWRSFNLVKEKADNVLIISHRDEFKEFVDRTTTITKRNGFSSIE
jgi:DNA repair exonuclease SbcCD ATPase subunit